MHEPELLNLVYVGLVLGVHVADSSPWALTCCSFGMLLVYMWSGSLCTDVITGVYVVWFWCTFGLVPLESSGAHVGTVLVLMLSVNIRSGSQWTTDMSTYIFVSSGA